MIIGVIIDLHSINEESFWVTFNNLTKYIHIVCDVLSVYLPI